MSAPREWNGGPEPTSGTVIVVESSPIIAADIVGAVENCGDYRIIHLADTTGLADAVADVMHITAAFVELSADDAISTGVADLLRARGAHVVLTMGEASADAADAVGFTMLLRPFSDQMILQALAEAEDGEGSVLP